MSGDPITVPEGTSDPADDLILSGVPDTPIAVPQPLPTPPQTAHKAWWASLVGFAIAIVVTVSESGNDITDWHTWVNAVLVGLGGAVVTGGVTYAVPNKLK